ncbi:MAG: TonB-dependent receptor, partial [Acidobacteria bacterium]|nr:TonB-dependent receptor [Acidobacteriota bacterium]
GEYRVIVQKDGFASVAKPGLELHVQDVITLNFSMQLGSVTQTITVEGGAPLLNTDSATVSTVVSRQFAENLPLNGRSFQALIELTPGVVVTPVFGGEGGQFSVNGQRSTANYFTVDGVSANVGITSSGVLSQSAAGLTPGSSAQGGTNSLVSVDAMQEFRIQTSTYAPEFGRTPGAQVSILTRSGTNEFHGALFEYLRNDILDANDWFANRLGLEKAALRQNDFGGVVGGPVVKDRTFLFVAYEGLRLRLPQTGITTVPSLSVRQTAQSSLRPFLDAYPLPNGADLGNGQAEFNATYSNKSSLDATSVRIDHRLTQKVSLFGRYNYSPSELEDRGGGNNANTLNTIVSNRFRMQTATVGTTWTISPAWANDLRFNYSRNRAAGRFDLDTFGGAIIPTDSVLFPASFSNQDSLFGFAVFGGVQSFWFFGRNTTNIQRQINVVDSLTRLYRTHSLKFGMDYRQLSPILDPQRYFLQPLFLDFASAASGSPLLSVVGTNRRGVAHFHNVAAYAQDTWQVSSRLTLTYGLRWELDLPPTISDGDLLAVENVDDLATLAVAPLGAAVFKTEYSNFAPRTGLSFLLRQQGGWETVLRGGFGVFYDLASQRAGDAIGSFTFPFGANKSEFGSFPLSSAQQQPPPISLQSPASVIAPDPDLELPYSLQWNTAVEQALGRSQAVAVSYVASVGRKLIQAEVLSNPNPQIVFAQLARNVSTSDYHSLQLQYQARMSHGLNAVASYTWAHSIDTASGSSSIGRGDLFVPGTDPNANRGSSDFDVRHSFSLGVSYDIPAPQGKATLRAVLGDWGIDTTLRTRSATPVDIQTNIFRLVAGISSSVRPDLIPGVPIYLRGSSFPGGRAINPAAFTPPPRDPVTRIPLRQGTLGRNAVRGFGASQWDLAVRRRFNLSEQLKLSFRAEFFNVLNHPNFGPPVNRLGLPSFGRSTSMLGRSLSQGSQGAGGFSELFQLGGPRSIQFGLKLSF